MENAARNDEGVPQLADAAALAAAERACSALAELSDIDPRALTADGLLRFVGQLGNAGRVIEGQQVANVAEIARRSDVDSGFDGLAARHGSSSPAGLFEKITGTKNSTAYRYVSVASRTMPRVSDTGAELPALFPATGAALGEGVVGLDVAEAITATLALCQDRVAPAALDAAEESLIANATGADGAAPFPADLIRQQARLFRDRLDPDGVEPRAEDQQAARSLTFRHHRDGMLSVAGRLSPEQAAVVIPVFDAHMSPRTSPAFMTEEERNATEADGRTRSQERADVFTALVEGVGKAADSPTLHGRAPTVLVVAAADDLAAGSGAARSPGTPESLPLSFVKQMQCDGETRIVTIAGDGNPLDVSKGSRFFTAKQRLALVARDGPTCAADECMIPAWLAEAHHIEAWNGENTTTVNGVLLCQYHHRLVELTDWDVGLIDGRARLIPPSWYVSRRYFGPRRPPQRE